MQERRTKAVFLVFLVLKLQTIKKCACTSVWSRYEKLLKFYYQNLEPTKLLSSILNLNVKRYTYRESFIYSSVVKSFVSHQTGSNRVYLKLLNYTSCWLGWDLIEKSIGASIIQHLSYLHINQGRNEGKY